MLTAFNEEKDHFITITTDNRLKLWNVSSGKLCQEFVDNCKLDENFNCIAWTSNSPWMPKKSKRKVVQHLGLVALGSSTGRIVLWDLQTGEQKSHLGEENNSRTPISDLVFNKSGSILYSCCSSKYACEWDVKEGKLLRKFRGDKEGVTKLSISKDNLLLALSGSSIRLYDLSTGNKNRRFNLGNCSSVSSIVISPCNRYLFSSSNGERFINVYDIQNDSKDPSCKFSMDNSPIKMEIEVDHSSEKSVIIKLAAVSIVGNIYIWRHQLDATSNKPVNHCTLVSTNSQDACTIINACFSSSNSLLVARNFSGSPVFDMAKFTDSNNQDLRQVVMDEVSGVPLTDGSKKQKEKFSSVHMLPTSDSNPPVKHDMTDISISKSEDFDNAPLGERLGELQRRLEDQMYANIEQDNQALKAVPSTNGKIPSSSLITVLDQAIHSKDTSMLEYCLRVEDSKVIEATVQKLQARRVISFLTFIIDRLEKRPVRGPHLCRWIHAIIMQHTSYLISVPDLSQRLSVLYQTLESRMEIFPDLWKLSGRLDLILGQIDSRKQLLKDNITDSMVVYNEDAYDTDGSSGKSET